MEFIQKIIYVLYIMIVISLIILSTIYYLEISELSEATERCEQAGYDYYSTSGMGECRMYTRGERIAKGIN